GPRLGARDPPRRGLRRARAPTTRGADSGRATRSRARAAERDSLRVEEPRLPAWPDPVATTWMQDDDQCRHVPREASETRERLGRASSCRCRWGPEPRETLSVQWPAKLPATHRTLRLDSDSAHHRDGVAVRS